MTLMCMTSMASAMDLPMTLTLFFISKLVSLTTKQMVQTNQREKVSQQPITLLGLNTNLSTQKVDLPDLTHHAPMEDT